MSARELAVLISLCTVWGFHFVVIKTAVDAVPPIFYAAMRMSLVALVMAPFLRWRPGRMAPVIAAGLCLGALNYALMFNGVRHATASASAIAVELYAPFATILSVIFLGEKVGWRRTAGITLAFAGVALIALGKDEARVGFGVGLVAIASFMEATGAILVKRAKGFRPQELLAWFAVIGTVFLWSASFVLEEGQGAALREADPVMLTGAVVYSALGASVFAHTAYYWLLQRLPVSQVAPSALLTTLMAVGFSAALLGEPLSARFLIGGAVALTGVAIILFRGAKTSTMAPVASAPMAVGATAAEPGKEKP